MSVGRRGVISAVAIIALIIPVLMAQANTADLANEFFERTWQRTDLPVETGQVDRTWMWGPGPNTGPMWEQYLESPDGQREVQYFDKSRMELNLTGEPEDSVWYVTNGLLVVEMVTGEIQIGEDTFVPHEADTNNVAGDRAGTSGPNYAALEGLLPAVGDRGHEAVTQIVDAHGNVTEDPGLADQGVHTAHYDEITGHNVAGPFWEFMTSSGLVYENGNYVQGAMFLNPVYATGRPITEPYWAHVPVDGNEQWVLLQAFERRVLTYTPGNEEGWKVEAGNVGRHYFEWRYGYPVDHEPPDDGIADDGVADDGIADDGVADDGVADDGVADDGVADDGVADDGVADDGVADDGVADDGVDDDNGPSLPTSLITGISGQVNALGTQINVNVQLNNPSQWDGTVELQLWCDGDLVDSGTVNINAGGGASLGLGGPTSGLLDIEFCTVTALIGSEIIDSSTVAIVSLLPDLPVLPDLGLDVDAEITNVNSGVLSSCDATVNVSVQLTNSNDYVGPAQVSVQGLGINHTQTVQIDGSGSIPVNVPAGQGIGLGNLVNVQAYNVTVTVDGQTVASGSAATVGLNAGSLLCLL